MQAWTHHVVQSPASLNFRNLLISPISHTHSDGFSCTDGVRHWRGDAADGTVETNPLLVGSNRDGVVIRSSLQVIYPFPAHLWWRSGRWILRRILDAFCNWLSGLLLW